MKFKNKYVLLLLINIFGTAKIVAQNQKNYSEISKFGHWELVVQFFPTSFYTACKIQIVFKNKYSDNVHLTQ